jgi:hypothetical protein
MLGRGAEKEAYKEKGVHRKTYNERQVERERETV